MNLQENIRRILKEEYTLPNLIRRRFSEEELDKLVSNVERTFETHRISQQHREDVIDAEVDDFIMNSVYYGEFEDFDDEIYQDIYNQYREPLVDYIKSKIDMNLQESIIRILREESDLYDNPRKVVKQHNDYDLIVDKISSLKDPNKIKNIIEKWILKNESYFADLIFDNEGEEYISCEHAAEMVSQILSDSNKKHKLQVGNIKKQSHA